MRRASRSHPAIRSSSSSLLTPASVRGLRPSEFRARPAGVEGAAAGRPSAGTRRGSGGGGCRQPGFAARLRCAVPRPAGRVSSRRRGWKPVAKSTRSTWSRSSPCSSSVNATRRARRRAAASRRLGERGLGPLRVRGLHVGGEPAQVAPVHRRQVAPHRDRRRVGSAHARSNCSRRVSVRTIGELVPSRSPRPSAGDVSATGSSTPSGMRSKRSARCRKQQERGGPERREPERLDVAASGDRGRACR